MVTPPSTSRPASDLADLREGWATRKPGCVLSPLYMLAPSRNTQGSPTCETTQVISGHFLELWVVPGPGERKLHKIQCLVWLECGWEKHKKTKLLTLTHITLYSHNKHRSIWDNLLKIWSWEGHAKGPKMSKNKTKKETFFPKEDY